MKKIIATLKSLHILVLVCWLSNASAQKIDVKEKAKNAATNRADRKVDNSIDKGLDKIEEGIGGLFKKKNKSKKENNKEKSDEESKGKNGKKNDGDAGNQSQPSFASYNKFDFIPGDKILAFDDFMQDAPGDLPAKWNSTGAAEIATINGSAFNWVQLSGGDAYFNPQYITKMPDNCTVDFDMIINYSKVEYAYYQLRFGIEIISSAAAKAQTENANVSANTGICFNIHPYPDQEIYAISYVKGETQLETKAQFAALSNPKPIHVSIMRQQQRIKIYFNDKKVYDLPQGLPAAPNYYLRFSALIDNRNDDKNTAKMYVSNLRYAAGKPDMRNKLLTEGKLVTRGILFDPGSAIVKPESAGVLKEIAAILNDNKELRVKIVGHTDSDGDNTKNQQLSEARAMAIKSILVEQYNVNEDYMTAEGKGETQPVDANTTAAGKANNRRVELIKL
ncbi:OmpA family protein [Pseudobacter ginsenosidimutans]|uniref:OmpA family protein n=1 Tax=Pseudobacter ginsenosidimutans TaxID=661488 RepID=A0A4Q7N4V3_9BACT|nr:OmpA family protein [Pseudobacter ginsenosidimutans]QEC44584.1 OmpA family protein [Pseudobacter ginsenosidimutans]RZS76063.1 OmpA family protein [Pseudobacter ginsenosidimutans]